MPAARGSSIGGAGGSSGASDATLGGGGGGGVLRTLTELKAAAGAGNNGMGKGRKEVGVGGVEEKEQENRGRGERQTDNHPTPGESGGGRGSERSSEVVVRAADPAVLVRPPRVGDGKLEHDKERRLGVASDLEAVIAVSGGEMESVLLGLSVGIALFVVCGRYFQ